MPAGQGRKGICALSSRKGWAWHMTTVERHAGHLLCGHGQRKRDGGSNEVRGAEEGLEFLGCLEFMAKGW